MQKVRLRQFNYYSKKHIDAAFAKYEVDSDLTEWYTPEDIQEKYGMTRVAIRSHVYRNNIPSKKEHGQIYYSKLHFDLSKNLITDETVKLLADLGRRAVLLDEMLHRAEAFDRIGQRDDRALVDQFGNGSLVDRIDRELSLELVPRILLKLLVTQRQATVLLDRKSVV